MILRSLGLVGLVMPWRSIYYLRPWNKSPEFVRHEMVHIAQINRDGPFIFSIKYLYWLVRYGYKRNPYELEAYQKEAGAVAPEVGTSTGVRSGQW